MNDETKAKTATEETDFSRQVAAQAARKLKAQRSAARSVWFGLGMSGLIGWSVTVPALLGAAIGIWLDRHYPAPLSWTLTLLLLGLILGCFNAWHWIDSQNKEMHEDPNE